MNSDHASTRATRPVATAIALALLVGVSSAFAEPPKDFTVSSPADGMKFQLSEAKGKYVALHFLLKTECPVCLRHARDYARKAASLPEVVQVFLKPDSEEEIRKWTVKMKSDTTIPLRVYRDADATLAKEYGIPDGYHFHGEVVHFPALVLLDPSGKEVFRHVGKNNTERFGFEQLAAKVGELQKLTGGSPSKPAKESR